MLLPCSLVPFTRSGSVPDNARMQYIGKRRNSHWRSSAKAQVAVISVSSSSPHATPPGPPHAPLGHATITATKQFNYWSSTHDTIMAPLVKSAQIASATLHNPLSLTFHTYIWPFLIIWPIFTRYYSDPALYEKHIQSSEWTFVWCGTIITAQSLVWLSTHWNVNLRSLFTSTRAKSVKDARLIKVMPVANAGAADICPLVRDNVSSGIQKSGEWMWLMKIGWWKAEHLVPFPEAQIPL